MSLTVYIKDLGTPTVAELRRKLTPQRLSAAVGPAVAREVQRHLVGLGTNKRGWPSTHFWARAAKATNWREDPAGALVSINQIGVRQRYHGGTIKPVKARALTIPISPVSYGRVASDFPGLFLLKTKAGAFLVQHGEELKMSPKGKSQRLVKRGKSAGGNAARRIQASLNFLFKLAGSVEQDADYGVLPTDAVLEAAAKAAILQAIK